MVRVDYLEGQISDVEGFDVAIHWPDGTNITWQTSMVMALNASAGSERIKPILFL